jgi:hypothetical protein
MLGACAWTGKQFLQAEYALDSSLFW